MRPRPHEARDDDARKRRSDYSASIVGAHSMPTKCGSGPTWTGVMTANRRSPRGADRSRDFVQRSVRAGIYGAKVLHYKTILPAFRQRIPCAFQQLQPDDHRHPGHRRRESVRTGGQGRHLDSRRDSVASSGTGMQGIHGIAAKTFDVSRLNRRCADDFAASSEKHICSC